MTASDCPNARECPVPKPPSALHSRNLRLRTIPKNHVVFRTYELKWGYDSFNPGKGDTRFVPLSVDGVNFIPTMYAGEDEQVALLESVFHDVHHEVANRVVYLSMVRNWGLACVGVPRNMSLIDLRDDALAELGLHRDEIVTTQAEHYCCTREWAQWLHSQSPEGVTPDGIVWHSRQAELHDDEVRHEVFMFFGDRAPATPGAYPLTLTGVRNLVEGPGLAFLERIAEDLKARVEPDI